MTRLNAFILMLVMLSSLYLVKVAYESRSLFVALDRAQTEERRLETEFEKLQVEKRGQATPLRVEKVAREKLAMRTATPAVTQYVNDAPPSAAPRQEPGLSRDGLPLRPGEEAAVQVAPVAAAGQASGATKPQAAIEGAR
ncbi:hypothetical protein BH09PSE5_BH09PSE5_31890 [soil metagenome]